MLSNIFYKFSTFADYSNLAYSKENMDRFMGVFGTHEFLPEIINEVNFDGTAGQRIQLSTVDRRVMITFLNGRIDIQISSDRKEGFTETEQTLVLEQMKQYIADIYNICEDIIQNANRLAWNVSYAYFEISDEKKAAFRNRFLTELPYYRDKLTDEFSVQYVGHENIVIHEKAELFNVLTLINRWFPGNGVGNVSTVDGYKVDFDINTNQKNKKNRFDIAEFAEFIDRAFEVQQQLEESVLNGCR